MRISDKIQTDVVVVGYGTQKKVNLTVIFDRFR